MKKTIISLSLLFSGIFILGISGFIVNTNLQNTTKWSNHGLLKGIFWQTAIDLHLIPIFFLSFLLIFLGLIFSINLLFKN